MGRNLAWSKGWQLAWVPMPTGKRLEWAAISNNVSGDPLRADTGRKGRIAALHTLIG
jgi:hypothetical protein